MSSSIDMGEDNEMETLGSWRRESLDGRCSEQLAIYNLILSCKFYYMLHSQEINFPVDNKYISMIQQSEYHSD